VHIGRLIYAVPLLSLLAARGLVSVFVGIERLLPSALFGARMWAKPCGWWAYAWRVPAIVVLLVVVAVGSWRDYTVENPLGGMAQGEVMLRARAPELAASGRTAVILTNLAPQGLAPQDPAMEIYTLVGYRLVMDRTYRFVDLARNTIPTAPDPRALALLGGDPALVLDRAELCAAVYFAPEDVLPALSARTASLGCTSAPEVVLLQR